MDFSFHIQQGQKLMENQDSSSIRKALEHFRSANEITEDGEIAKPKVLYHLAWGNYIIGNIEQSFRIAHKALRSIDTAVEASIFSMNNMRQLLGEDDITELIDHINEKYPSVVLFTDEEDDDFDENELDFSLVDKLYGNTEKEEIKPEFTLDSLSEQVLVATFNGLSRTEDQNIYFDSLKGDVLSFVDGYFSSHIGDQTIANKILYDKIMNNEPTDFVDEGRYLLIDRLKLVYFLEEYRKQTRGKEPFSSFVDLFSVEVLNDFSQNRNIKITDLANSSHIQEKFHDLFSKRYVGNILELKNDYLEIFQNTVKSLARNWIVQNIPSLKVQRETEMEGFKLDFVFESSDHIRYENGMHVAGPHGGAGRAIKVEPNLKSREGVLVTMFNLEGPHPLWQDNIQMAPKQMRVIKQTSEMIVLRGFGQDAMGSSYADYGLTIKLRNGNIGNCVLHMHDRGVDIEYLP